MADPRAVKLGIAAAKIRNNFHLFFGYVQNQLNKQPSYPLGPHSKAMLRALQECTEAVERGENRYLIINMPPRHGKTDICGRTYPIWHLARNPRHEIILASYGAQLSNDISRMARDTMAQCCKDGVIPHKPSQSVFRGDQWGLDGYPGRLFSVGLGGTITGRGGNIIIIDDYLKNREEAESVATRDKLWSSFRNDLLTRRAPTGHAVIIVATRWHEDDLVGRIHKAMEDNPKYPRYETITFPAQNEDTGEYLFPERFDAAFYESIKAEVGSYAWQSLYQQDPKPREGNMLRGDLVNFINASELPEGLRWIRAWDLSSTDKQRSKDDPDYTVGTLAAYDDKNHRVYIRNVRKGQWSALKRDKIMVDTAKLDKQLGCANIVIEGVAGYKDTYTRMKSILKGHAIVKLATPRKDKVARASETIEALFEAGEIYAVRASWNDNWMNEVLTFPTGAHDDQVDSLVLSVYDRMKKSNVMTSIIVGGL